MKIPHHNRYDYSSIRDRRDFSWPAGKRLAVYIAVNVEHFAFGAPIGHQISAQNHAPDHRAFCWRDYGNRVGFWRLLDTLDALEFPACHLMNSTMFDYAPEIGKAAVGRGDEIVGHGRTNSERQGELWEEDEARLIGEARDVLEARTGKRPRGWMGPWLSQSHHTPDLLQEAGFEFLMDWPCDDQPIWLRTRAGRMMAVPYGIDLNDATQMLFHHHTAQAYGDMLIDRFDEMLRQAKDQPLVCAIPVHPMIVGQPHRLPHLRRALTHIHSHREDVWLTRPGEIYDYCASLPDGTIV
jgi:peptidoglycan/xylan/chitin deacetylase (PgdA/CDA1 family)